MSATRRKLILLLGKISVADVETEEEMKAINALHKMLKPPPRVRKPKVAVETPTPAKAEKPKSEKPKSNFAVNVGGKTIGGAKAEDVVGEANAAAAKSEEDIFS